MKHFHLESVPSQSAETNCFVPVDTIGQNLGSPKFIAIPHSISKNIEGTVVKCGVWGQDGL